MTTSGEQQAARGRAEKRQGELSLFQVGPGDGPAVEWLERELKAWGVWRTAADLLASVGKTAVGDGARWIRMLAEASDRVISGQKGYKHVEHCTAEEIGHFVNWMESQGKKMIRRAERVRRVAHAVFG